jgi:hypothetical protein
LRLTLADAVDSRSDLGLLRHGPNVIWPKPGLAEAGIEAMMMHSEWAAYLRVLLALHIACGAVGFVCAPVALASAKGGATHRRWGKIYFWAMTGVAATALAISLVLPIFFLAMVSVFSFYLSFAAYRVLFLKDMYKGARAQAMDWVAAIVTVLASFLLLVMGLLRPEIMRVGLIQVAGHRVSIVSIVFGAIGMRFGLSSIFRFIKPPAEKMFWWFDHMQGMIGSYIAAMTAFSSVNLGHWFGDAWWVWLWPTMVGVPAISMWRAYYKRKFSPKPRTVAA